MADFTSVTSNSAFCVFLDEVGVFDFDERDGRPLRTFSTGVTSSFCVFLDEVGVFEFAGRDRRGVVLLVLRLRDGRPLRSFSTEVTGED